MGALTTILFAVRIITLEQALQLAEEHQPQLAQARATTDAARARADEARAPLLPQLTGAASYQRTTANFVARPGIVPSSLVGTPATPTFTTFDFWSFNLNLNQLVWDFQSVDRYRAAKETARAQGDTARTTDLQVRLMVRTAYFAARAQHALVGVARDTLANQDRHLAQIQGFVSAGTRPDIDLAQARTDRANALVQVIQSENNYEVSKAQLNQAMGVEGPTDFDVADEPAEPIDGESSSDEALLPEALRARPEMASLDAQVRSQLLVRRANLGGYLPGIGFASALSDAGVSVTNLAWNWNATVNVTWNLFNGLLTPAQVAEAAAGVRLIEAQRDQERQQIRLEVTQARLAVRAAKITVSAAEEALVNARLRYQLAEGRYQAGVGSVIELGDAQVALTTAAAQRVQADYSVATARAQLGRALGRK
jgi:outer membrane protein